MTGRAFGRRPFILGSLATVVLAACRSGDDAGAPAGTTSPGTPAPSAASSVPPGTPAPGTTSPLTTVATGPPAPADPFMLGVASGDPTSDAVILWTRLALQPIGGGMPAQPVTVAWEVATDEAFTDVATTGTTTAVPEQAHSVHVDAVGLSPSSTYWYRFSAGGFTSPIGRTRTMPPPGEPAELVLGHASCQHYETGFYAAHRDIAAAELDALVWLGDYIYEGAARPVDGRYVVRSHDGPEPLDLAGYRDRYALYKLDPDLQAAHRSTPWYVLWDDHEVDNNYAGGDSADPDISPEAFSLRRAAAYQAWWEHQPVRLPPPEDAAEYRTYRSFELGSVASLHLLDGRQFRTEQACGGATLDLSPACPEVLSHGRTMLGEAQEQWLLDGLRASTTSWRILANQTVLADLTFNGAVLNYDQWDGYPDARQRLLYGLDQEGVANLVTLTGDIHIAMVNDLGVEDENGRHVVGTELVATSISSTTSLPPGADLLVSAFSDVRYAQADRRGWVRSVVSADVWEAEYRYVDDATLADAAVTAGPRFRFTPDQPGAERVR